MNIKFDSQYLMRNFSTLADIVNNKVQKSYSVTKESEGIIDLKKDEVVIFKVFNSKLERDYKVKYNTKYQHLIEHTIQRNISSDSELIKCDIMITNKYIHLLFEKGVESINLSKIIETYISPNILVLYTEDKKYRLTINDINFILQIVFIIDVLKDTKLDDSFVGKTITIAINE